MLLIVCFLTLTYSSPQEQPLCGALHPVVAVTAATTEGAREALPQQPEPAPKPKPAIRPKVLFLSHSAGFMHDVVKRPAPGELSLAEREFVELAKDDFEVIATQNCADLNPEMLGKVAAVAFYTTGELPIEAANRDAFMDWMLHGGAFVGIHCATDTFYKYAPYQRMVGGVFDGHPWHQEIRVDVLDGAHPAVATLERGFLITDEIYQFRDLVRPPLRELLRVEPLSIDLSKGARKDGNYPIAWCRDYGQGRVFYTSLGHRPEVWLDARFRRHLLGGLSWTIDGTDWKPDPPAHCLLLAGNLMGQRGWQKRDGSPAAWIATDDGMLEVVPGAGDVITHAEFSDATLHIEFSVPVDASEGEARGNSGVYLMGRYEIQVHDSLGATPGTGSCAAIYGQSAPSVNASKSPLAWQSFDIEFRAPRFDSEGAKSENARLTLWHNGVLVHDDIELKAATPGGIFDKEAALGPLLLQEHGSLVRYRNIWAVTH